MALNFEEIPSEEELVLDAPPPKPTVLDEINTRKVLVEERKVKCKDIKPLYEKPKKRPHSYTYKYFCVCPRYNPRYCCKHSGNVIIDRDVLTPEEHLVYLSTPKPNYAAPRNMPYYYRKKAILPLCTARINQLAEPDIERVKENFQKYQHVLNKRSISALQHKMKQKNNVEYTDISTAVALMEEDRRLKKVSKRMNKQRCKKMNTKILKAQRTQIKKIVCILFEEMKDFLLNDQFIMDERSTLVAIILETIREFTDKEFYTTSNLREYQKILAFNLAVWINKFISNLNIHIAPEPSRPVCTEQKPLVQDYVNKLETRPTLDLETHLPLDGYISCSSVLEDEGEHTPNYELTMPSEELLEEEDTASTLRNDQ